MPARPRGRRVVAAAGLIVALAAGAGAAALVDAGGGGSEARVAVPPGLAQLAGAARGRRAGRRATSQLVGEAARLPLERQVAQLFVVGFDGQYPRDAFFGALRGRDWGGVVLDRRNWVDRTQLAALAGEVAVVARAAGHEPPLVAADQSGGDANAFPGLPPRAQPAVGATARPQSAAAEARAAARELRSLHVNMTLAPTADVGTAGGGVEDRVFGDDATQVAGMAGAAVDAYRDGGMIAAVGHFPGQGAASQDPDVRTATVGLTLADLRRRDLLPFRAIADCVPVVVVSNAVYAAYDGVTPAVLLPAVIDRLLRRGLRFRGVAMTGDLAATALVTGESTGSVAVGALRAGADLLYVSGGPAEQEQAYRAVLEALRKGRLPRQRVQTALLRVLALKHRYGLSGAGAASRP